MKKMKKKLTALIAGAGTTAMMLGQSLTACAAPVADALPTQVTPGGVVVYDYYVPDMYGFTGTTEYPVEFLNAIDAAGITNEMSDYEKCVRINNYLCAVLTYGYNYAQCDELHNEFNNKYANRILTREEMLASLSLISDIGNIEDVGIRALRTGEGICADYAHAFQTMTFMLGMDSWVMQSSEMNHAWNIVIADGVTYYVDATWNDCTGTDDYLMSTELWADHSYADVKIIETDYDNTLFNALPQTDDDFWTMIFERAVAQGSLTTH